MISQNTFKAHAKSLLHLGMPILLGQLAQMSMNFVDTVVAGMAGTAHMAFPSAGRYGHRFCFSGRESLFLSVRLWRKGLAREKRKV